MVAAKQVQQRLVNHPQFRKAKKIGLYLSAFGEVDTQYIIEACFRLHKQVFLPMVCVMNQRLVWVQITLKQYRNRQFLRHRLGMCEAVSSRGMAVSTLDLLVMPLLACDKTGTRLGMGGGFYDRTLARALKYPYRLGLAHSFQLLDIHLVRRPWDQALDGLITPDKIYQFKR